MSNTVDSVKITFLHSSKSITVRDGENILELAQRANVFIHHTCNGKGTCGKCVVKIKGDVTPVTEQEKKHLSETQINEGYRLACECVPLGDIEVDTLQTGKPKILTQGLKVAAALKPNVTKQVFKFNPPTMKSQISDIERIAESVPGLKPDEVELGLLKALPKALRKENFKTTLVFSQSKVIYAEPGDTTETLYGVAFDIGTTTVVGYLFDLTDGKQLAVASELNPQANYGADVISRIEYTMNEPSGGARLQKAIVGCLSTIIDILTLDAEIRREHIYEVAIAGNTVMGHLALGLDVNNIAQAPFIPVVHKTASFRTEEIGLHLHPQARVYPLPHIASYVGADITADILAVRLDKKSKPTLVLDIGTNGEMVLGNKDRMLAAASAAGPCFEGGNITHGMRAHAGAISEVSLKNGKIKLTTIDNAKPKGICGTGIVDAIAELVKYKIVDEAGRVRPAEQSECEYPELIKRLKLGEKGIDFILVEPKDSDSGKEILVTQSDIRQVQNAKAAFSAGIKILCKEFGIEVEDVNEILLAGAFGNYISRESAIGIGLIPHINHSKIKSIGNAAGVGSAMTLLSITERKYAEKLADKVQYIELSACPDFNDEYADAMYFEE